MKIIIENFPTKRENMQPKSRVTRRDGQLSANIFITIRLIEVIRIATLK